ncbi:MAG: TolC family protein [Thermodesulfobacteriota bacterium]
MRVPVMQEVEFSRGRLKKADFFSLAVGLLIWAMLLLTAGPSMAADEEGGAEEPGNRATHITLKEAYQRSVLGHEEVEIADEGIMLARSSLKKADSEFLPDIIAEGKYQKYTTTKRVSGFLLQPDNSKSFDLVVSQPLFQGGASWHGRKSAVLSMKKSREGAKAAGEFIMLETARAFFNLLKAEKEVEIARSSLKRSTERREVAEARFEVGETTKTDLLRAESEKAGAEAALITARSSLKNARDIFVRFVPVSGEFSLKDPGIAADTSLNPEELIKSAYKNRLDLTQTSLDRQIADLGVKSSRSGFLPSLRVEGLYSRRDRDPATSFLLKESISATVVLTYPLFEGGLRMAEYNEAKTKARIEGLRMRALKKDIIVEVRRAYNNVKEKEAVIKSLKRQLSFARENYRMVFEQFKSGVATNVDVTDANTELLTADRSYMNALFDLELAVVELKYATGILHNEI